MNDATDNGGTFATQPDGGIRITGTQTSMRAQIISDTMPIPLRKGVTYTMSGSIDNVANLWLGFSKQDSSISELYGNKTFTVPDDVDSMFFGIATFSYMEGKQIDETLYPMLNEGGEPLPYVPYI